MLKLGVLPFGSVALSIPTIQTVPTPLGPVSAAHEKGQNACTRIAVRRCSGSQKKCWNGVSARSGQSQALGPGPLPLGTVSAGGEKTFITDPPSKRQNLCGVSRTQTV